MDKVSDANIKLVEKYKIDDTILESYFKNENNQNVTGTVFPLRIDNRQYCSPTDHQGKHPSCCGYSSAQILESINWMRTGKVVQLDANQIYAKAKQTDNQMSSAGTYPDLAMTKGLELFPDMKRLYCVKTTSSKNIDDLKRIIHANMFVCVNMNVSVDLYDLRENNFVYEGKGKKAGGHSLVCCGYDEESKMLIMQNHWSPEWGLKGFFLCPYAVWETQTRLTCWYERKDLTIPAMTQSRDSASSKKQKNEEQKKRQQEEDEKHETNSEDKIPENPDKNGNVMKEEGTEHPQI